MTRPQPEPVMEIGCPHGAWGMVVDCPHCGTPRHVSPSQHVSDRFLQEVERGERDWPADRPAEPTPTPVDGEDFWGSTVYPPRAEAEDGWPTPTGADRPTTEAIFREHRQCDTGKYVGCYAHWPTPHCRADGMAWPCDVDAIRAEARQQPQPLDVDVLAEALRVELGPEIVWRPIISDDPWRHYAERLLTRLSSAPARPSPTEQQDAIAADVLDDVPPLRGRPSPTEDGGA